MDKDRGFYECKKCKIIIEVESIIVKNGSRVKQLIHKCPNCDQKIDKTTMDKFNETRGLHLSVKKTYNKKSIDLGIKFL